MTTDAVGGVWRYTLDLAAGFAGRGLGVVVAVLGPPPSVAQRQEAALPGVQVMDTGLALDWTATGPAELAHARAELERLAKAEHAASVHLHSPALAGVAPWPIPVVAVAHSCVATWWRAVRGGPMPPDFAWRTAAVSAGMRVAEAVIAPTAAHGAALEAVYGKLPVHVVHNGRTSITCAGVRAGGPGQPVRERVALTAGRLWDEAKNAAALDRVARRLGAPIRAAGPVRGPNGAAVALANLELLGTLDAAGMARAYAGARVFVSMASYEPFGLAVLEAAQAGMRLVLSDLSGFRELWDGVASFVGSEDALLPALRRALDLPGDGGAQARAARYTVDAMADATLGVHRMAGALV